MIIIKIQGRLGNQMFQYAFAKKLMKKYYNNEEIMINYSKSKFSNKCDFAEDDNHTEKVFNFKKLRITKKLEINFIQKIIFYSYLIFKLIIKKIYSKKSLDSVFQKFLNYFGIYFLQDSSVCEFYKSKFKNKIVYGYFTSEIFFKDIENDIKRDFEININMEKNNQNFLNKIINSNSVCISIRRGDYLNKDISKFYHICDLNYYYSAINMINELVENPTYVVFSDEIDWVKENMNFPEGTLYESGNLNCFETLKLMINCKYYIISNSTFHWWAQYLSKNKNKIVIAPSIWNSKDSCKEIYQRDWKLIDINNI